MRSRSASSARSSPSALASLAGAFGGRTRPVTPSWLTQEVPVPSSVETQGRPAAIASSRTMPKASLRATAGRTNTSPAA